MDAPSKQKHAQIVKMDHFTKTMFFTAAANSVYDALTNAIPQWWTTMFEGISNAEGEAFTIRFGTNVFKTMTVEELIPGEKVVWYVTESLIDIPELNNKTEWIHTKMVWEISKQNGKTHVRLTHFGLTPQVECYNICENGWHNFTQSFEAFVNTGVGNPFKLGIQ